MKRRIISLLIAICIALSIMIPVASAEENCFAFDTVYFEDGSYMLIDIQEQSARATNSKSGNKVYSYYSNDDELLWKVILRGSFTYNGTTSSCTSSSVSIDVVDDSWYVVSNSADKTGSEASAVATMGKKLLGITINKIKVELTLSCDKNGVLS